MSKATKLNDKELHHLLKEFCKFMILKNENYGTRILPSKLIDLVWHQFILHTELYSQFCINHFGRYIHHRPLNKNPPFERTKTMMINRFGSIDYRYWQEKA